MKILLVSVELAPIAPGGGVAQYTMGLARALCRNGHDVHAAIPDYQFLSPANPELLDGITVHRLGGHPYFQAVSSPREIYRSDNFEPWMSFAKSVVGFLKAFDWSPDIIHCQDGHTSLVPVYVVNERKTNPSTFGGTGTVLTIHNLLEQGKGSRAFFDSIGVPPELFDSHFEFYGETNCYKAGLMMADRVSTVSRTYAHEITASEEFGFGLAGVLGALEPRPVGILNGIDGDSWRLPGAKYDGSDQIDAIIEEKRSKLRTLLPSWFSESHDPVLIFKARWDRQKGIELIAQCMEEILEHARFVFDTWGEPKDASGPHYEIWLALTSLRDRYPLRLAINVPGTTSPEESAALYTAGDFLLMPSVYEPCGLAQMECQRYGCVPIVRRTGGLADTVSDHRTQSDTSNGFLFNTMTREGLLSAVRRAVQAHAVPQMMQSLIANAMRQQNEWHHRMAEYEALYNAAKPGATVG
jgi:starch synthase